MKQYLKRVLSIFIFFNALIILTGIFASFAQQILFFAEVPDKTLYLIGSVPASISMLYFVYLYRWENRSMKQRYFETLISDVYSFKSDFIAALRARENIIHTMAFLTIVLVFDLRIAISEHTPLMPAILNNGDTAVSKRHRICSS